VSAPVRLERDGDLSVVVLDSPPLNLFDHAMMSSLEEVVSALEVGPGRAVLLRAEGRVVSGGVDVGAVFDGLDRDRGEAFWAEWLAVIGRLEALPVPTVFAAHALCLTAAFEVALACDMLVAAQSARFGLVEIVVGLTPSMGGPQRLAERAGPARAKELIMTGELLGAETLAAWNVVNRVFPDETFAADARAFARRLAEGPTLAHGATKAIVRSAVRESVAESDRRTPALSAVLFDSEDLRKAVRSFIDDGPGNAEFAGR
jgi:enoyl-CoA hydratase/carnithine racemase